MGANSTNCDPGVTITAKPVSRQRRWQIARNREGRCPICGKPKVTKLYCAYHSEQQRTISRNYYRLKHDIPISAPIANVGRKRIVLPTAIANGSAPGLKL